MDDLVADLVAFIRARIAEERADAEAATPGPWTVHTIDGSSDVQGPPGRFGPVGVAVGANGASSEEDAAHIARQDPAATLARLDALTALVDHLTVMAGVADHLAAMTGAVVPNVGRAALRHVAAIWRDHADYRPEWAV